MLRALGHRGLEGVGAPPNSPADGGILTPGRQASKIPLTLRVKCQSLAPWALFTAPTKHLDRDRTVVKIHVVQGLTFNAVDTASPPITGPPGRFGVGVGAGNHLSQCGTARSPPPTAISSPYPALHHQSPARLSSRFPSSDCSW